MKKNDILTVEIIDNGMNFEGIAKVEGMTVFVPYAILGEKVEIRILKVNKNFAFAKIEKVLESSSKRTEAVCPISKSCGSCESQHMLYDYELNLKRKNIQNLFKKQGVKFNSIQNTIGMGIPYYYRNKVAYPVRNINEKNMIGFYSNKSHNIIENNCCYIQNRVIDMLSKIVFDKLINLGFNGYNEKDNSGDIRHIILKRGYHTGEIMLIVVVNNNSLLKDKRFLELINLDKNIKSIFLNLNSNTTNEIMGKESICIYGDKYITDLIGDYSYYISPKSFFQVNTLQAEVLYYTLKDNLNLNKNDILFDLYSGVGSIGIFLSDSVNKVYGIEIEEEAVKMANLNLSRNNVTNCEYIAGSVEDKIEEFKSRNIHPDIIVVDPPRRGLDQKSIDYILDFNPKKIGYVSCNPATLARDLKLLEDKYEIKEVIPVDLFPKTHHVECVCVLEKLES